MARPDIVGVYVGFTLCLFGFALLWATFMACVNELLGSSSYPIFFGFFNFVYSVLQLGLNTCVWVPAFQASGEYSHAFMVYACVCFASALVALMLGWTVRGFYSAMPE
uniref:Uncharacterized protein n=1 Tax=Zooxanthella nutricula TaxID=1333877 RepID=A0A7S2PTY2_9DINO